MHLVENLAHRHNVSIVSFQKPDEPLEWQWFSERGINISTESRPAPLTIPGISKSLKAGSVYVGVHTSGKLQQSIDHLMTNCTFDLVHVVSSYMIQNLPQSLSIRLVVEEPNLQSLVLKQQSQIVSRPLRWLYIHEAIRLESMQLQAAKLADSYICSSPTDANAMRASNHRYRVRIVPNGVDTDQYSFRAFPKAPIPLLVFLGNFNYFPNVDAMEFFVRDVFPDVLSSVPDIKLNIVGYQADVKLAHLKNSPAVEIQGYKPDIRGDLAQAWISICPLRSGSGSRIKILESMAIGTPVVSTPIGCTGLPVRDGENIVVAPATDLAETIVELVNSPQARNRIAINARRLVETQMTWTQAAARLEAIYSETLNSPHKVSALALTN